MAIGTLSVNVAASTPRANAALKATAGLIRTVGRSGEEAGPGVRMLVGTLKALAAPAVAGAAAKGLTSVATAAGALSVGKAATAGSTLLSIGLHLGKIASIFIPGGSLIRLLALGGAALGIRAANKEVSELVARLDSIGKRAGKIGIGVAALDQLRFAAQTTGVDTQKLDTALEKMNIRIAEAARGGGEAVKVLAEMGLSAQKLNALPTEEKLLAIADGLAQYGNQSDKLRVAAKLFEEEGTALVQTLAGGSQAVRALMADAAALGNPTEGMARAAAEFADQSARAEKTWQALGDKIGATLLPLKSLLAGASALAGKGANLAFDATAAVAGAPGGAFRLTRDAVTDVAVGLATDGDATGARAGALSASQQAAADARVAAAAAPAARQAYAEFLGSAGKSIAEAASKAARRLEQPVAKFRRAIDRAATDKRRADAVEAVLDAVGSRLVAASAAVRRLELRGQINSVRGLNPLTGLAPTGPSDARLALEARRLVGGTDRVNTLLEADSREGYLALRANERRQRDNPVEKKVESNTKRTADGVQQTVDAMRTLLGYFKNAPPPAKA